MCRSKKTLFIQGNQVRTDQNKPQKETNKKEQRDKQTKVCFDQYELDYLGRTKFIHVEMPYYFKVLSFQQYKTIYILTQCIKDIIRPRKNRAFLNEAIVEN